MRLLKNILYYIRVVYVVPAIAITFLIAFFPIVYILGRSIACRTFKDFMKDVIIALK